jgi:phosphatidylserine/phosphatidylglycerophosphate/cardiolipin synthase-like enzyme
VHGAIGLTSIDAVVAAIEGGRNVRLDAYVIENRRLIGALEHAAAGGASVEVHLCAKPHDEDRLGDRNRRLARELQAFGVQVTSDPAFGRGSRHDKVAVVDGTAYFDDRNWRTDDAAILCEPSAAARPLQTKAAVLSEEARLISNGGGHDVLVSTESLGAGPVVDALVERARRGDRVRLIYNPAESTRTQASALERLRSAHVEIEQSAENHKLAIVGNVAWMGSANATCVGGPTGAGLEWGRVVTGGVAASLAQTAENIWIDDAAHPPVYRHPRA